MAKAAKAWSWRDRDPAHHAGLRYEPGNWGDVLKGEWALLALEALLTQRAPTPALRVLDPFAGAPSYPLSPASAERLQRLPADCQRFAAAQAPFALDGRLASTATLLAAARPSLVQLSVYDRDTSRRGAWSAPASVLEADDGAAALEAARGDDYDLVHVDPYDLQSDWGTLLRPGLAALAPHGVLLAYLFNKAPRGGGHAEQYESLRNGLANRLRDDQAVCVGRVAADAVLPRAWHELLLVGPRALTQELRGPLRASAQALASQIATEGAFEG